MIRISAIVLTLVVALSGSALAQGGFMDAVFGPGGLGLWGGGDPSQFNVQQHYGPPPQDYGQQGYQQQGAPYGYQQGYPPQGYSYPQGQAMPYGNQPGVYADWYNYPQGQTQAPSGPPPVRYTAPPGQAAPTPQVQAAPPPQAQAPAAGQAAPYNAPLRPGQYSPSQIPPGSVDELPAGAVRVTTTTPEGTTVQFYPPEGQPMSVQPGSQQQPRRIRSQPAAKRRPSQPREQSAATAPSSTDTSVVMPKPVEMPSGQDPRAGWSPR